MQRNFHPAWRNTWCATDPDRYRLGLARRCAPSLSGIEPNLLNFSYTLTEKLRLLKDGDSFSAEDGAVLMQSSSQTGVQLFNGCVDYKLTPFSEAKVTLPADAEMKLYTLSFSSNKYYEDRSVLTNVAFAGDTIFVCKASYYMNYMDDAWFYGIMEGDKITFPSGQYMGYYEGGYGLFPVYFYGGEVTGQDESGYDIVAAGDELVLTLDEDGSFFSSDYYVMMLGGTIEEECWNLRLRSSMCLPPYLLHLGTLHCPLRRMTTCVYISRKKMWTAMCLWPTAYISAFIWMTNC